MANQLIYTHTINIYTCNVLTILHNLCKCRAQCLVYRDHSNVLCSFPVLILNSFMSTTVCVIVLPSSASALTICFPYNKLKKVSKHKPDYVTPALKIFQYYPSVTMKKKKKKEFNSLQGLPWAGPVSSYNFIYLTSIRHFAMSLQISMAFL